MQVGYACPNVGSPPTGPDAMRIVSQAADDLGFHSMWLADHIVKPLPADSPRYTWDLYEPLVSAAYVAALTKRVKLAFGVLILPYRNPVVTAKMLASIDRMSNGRLIAGVGVGYLKGEFQALGIPQKNTGAMTDEYIDAFRALWASEEPTFHGRWVNVENVIFRPRPVQDPVPIWIGGVSEPALDRTARLGDGWYTVIVGVEDTRQKVARLKELLESYGRRIEDIAISVQFPCRLAGRVYSPDESYPIQPGALKPVAIGPPDYLVEQLMRYHEAGANHAVVRMDEGTPAEDVKQMEKFASTVMPQLPKPTSRAPGLA